MPQGPPPVVPPPPAPASSGGGGRRGLPLWLLVAIIVAVVAAAAAAALIVLLPRDEKDDGHASTSPSASVSPSGSVSPSASPSPSPTLAAGFPMAVASGAKANILATVDAAGTVSPLSDPLGAQVYQVSWSPDGRRLACVAGAWNQRRLWLADIESGSLSEVSITEPSVVAVDSVAWLSPTELLVAGFTVKPVYQGGVAEFLVYDVAAGAVRGPLQDGSGGSLRGVSVSASADGGRVAYVTYTDQKNNQYGMPTATEQLELLDRGTGSVTQLGTGEAYFDVNARRFDDPLIAPDGQAVIYRAAGSDVGTSYTVVDANGSVIMHSKELNFPAGYAWDPSGRKVVFTGHSVNGNGGPNDRVTFYVFDRDKGGKPGTIATYKDTMVQDVSWSPDGSTIAFADWDRKHYTTGKVYQLSAGGGDAHHLVDDALSPAYRPASPSP
jgi:Tol biopolymer transport system component